ncbi:MAG: WhiB family transcriptional regulator [Candidatus Dormibacteria bacterium]
MTFLRLVADESPSWHDNALCAQTDPEAFFPEKGDPNMAAKKVCFRCDVRAECLEYALNNREHFGIWGGLSALQRNRLRRDRGIEHQEAA